jgi:hypothetical protein
MTKTYGGHHTLCWQPLIDWFTLCQPSKILPQFCFWARIQNSIVEWTQNITKRVETTQPEWKLVNNAHMRPIIASKSFHKHSFTWCNLNLIFSIGWSYNQLKHKMVVLFLVTSQPIGIVYKSPTTLYNLWYLDLHRPSDKVVQSELILKTLFEYHYNDTGWIDRDEFNTCDMLWQRVIVLPPYSTMHQTYVWPSCQPFVLDP